MARFHYRMQSILDIKLKMETQAKQDLAMARRKLDVEIERLERLEAQKKVYEEEAKSLLNGSLRVRDIQNNKSAILHTDGAIREQQLQIKVATKQFDSARQRLRVVMQERKTHETLKEKAFEEFMLEENRRESKEVDELTSYTYGQRRSNSKGG